MPFSALIVERTGDRHWTLTEPLTFHGNTDIITVPAGYTTDFASVPRFLQWLAPSTGPYSSAAVLHDWLCDSLVGDPTLPPDSQISSRDADGLFRRAMRQEGVSPVLRWLMWCGVRWGAVFNRRRRPGILRDIPAMLGLSLLALPLVVPASVCIGASLLVLAVYQLIAKVVVR